jgi:hypothetical protein
VLPNFFIIGAPKCGTTALHSYLSGHPEIHMSPVKEPHFFSDPDPRFPLTTPQVTDRSEYEALFESAAPRRGEASPSYSQWPLRFNVPENIHGLIPDARIIYLVGDPVERTVSQWVQRVAYEGERRPLAEAIGENLEEPTNIYACASRYATQLERFLGVFGDDSVLVVDKVDLRDRRAATLREVFAFLEVSPDFESPVFAQEANASRDHRSLPAFYLAARRTGLKRAVDALPRCLTSPALRATRRIITKPIERPSVDDRTRERLMQAFEPEVRRLRLLTGKTFSDWSI